ncbi:hypothetical protein BD779DRAFT_1489499 [Infundibulicybe gibba]|nr:hypothetical protein BD779DRAFT_1489499 [Infundibulicybe gibba]
MPLIKDDSIAGDSTISSTSPSRTPVIKRAAVTYGRRREVALENDPASSGSRSTQSSGSRQSVFRTGVSDMEEEIPPSSEPPHVSSDLDDSESGGGGNSKDASSPFKFAWKDKLKEIDEQDDFDMDISSRLDADNTTDPPPQPAFDQPLLHQKGDTEYNAASTLPLNNPPTLVPGDVFGVNLSTPTSPLLPTTVFGEPSALLSTRPEVQPSTRANRRKVVLDSDSEQNTTKDTNSPSAASPPLSRSVTTPYLRSSTTPPTSDDDMPARILPKNRLKGKGKVSTRTIPPLLFDEQETRITESAKRPSAEKNKKSKIKAPTKKELAETTRDRLRIAAEQKVSIPRAEGSSSKYSIQGFFASLVDKPTSNALGIPSSDPIVPFSSPAERKTPPQAAQPNYQHSSPGQPATHVSTKLNDPNSSSDPDDLPKAGVLINTNEERKRKGLSFQKQKELLEVKKRALAQQSAQPERSDSDDDLEVVYDASQSSMQAAVKREDDVRKSGTKPRLSEGRKRQLWMGGISLAERKVRTSPSIFGAPKGHGGHGKPGLLNQTELSKVLSDKVRQENEESIKRKEEEWTRRGGKASTSVLLEPLKDVAGSVGTTWKTYAEKGLKAAVESAPSMDVDEDESDDDWAPDMRGSASPPPREGSQNSQDEEEQEHEADGVPIVDQNAESEADETGEGDVRPPRRAMVIVDSDSDDETSIENKPVWAAESSSLLGSKSSCQTDEDTMPPPRPPLVSMMHRGSLSSLDEPTEDEGDKENNSRFMLDRSEDKENAVMQGPWDPSLKRLPLGTESSLFDLEDGIRSGLSMSPLRNPTGGDGDDEASDTNESEKRKPLREILADDDLFTSPAKGPVTSSLTKRLQQTSPIAGTQSTSTFRPSPLINRKNSGFSQFSDDDEAGVSEVLLQPSFTKLFQSSTQHPTKADKPFGELKDLNSSFPDEQVCYRFKLDSCTCANNHQPVNGLEYLRKARAPDDLTLTQDLVVQPVFVAGEGLLRKADSIFEKEQAYLLEKSVEKPHQTQELYVNDLGFLTQTRPNVSSPEVYRPPPPSHPSTLYHTQTQPLKGITDDFQATERRPLQTLSLSSVVDLDSPEREPLRRLMRQLTSPPRSNKKGTYQMSPPASPSPRKRPQNAFDALARGSKLKAEKPKTKLGKSEFVEAEAQESDEDDIFGFGVKKDDEEEGEDLDKTLETLVDDQEMDEDTVAAELVIEKYKEQEELDDQENEKLHQAAIHGELRNRKRNHGVGLDDSDEDSDEDERNQRIRRAMNKRMKIGRDDIKQLGEHDDTRSFFNVYKNDLVDDDNADLSYLQDSQDVTMTAADEEVDGNEEEPRGFISRDEIRQRVRELAQSEQVDQPLDPNDVSWIDNGSEDESSLRVKSVPTAIRKTHPHRGVNTVDTEFDGTTELRKSTVEKECERNRMQSWARGERRSRNAGTGRSVGGAAVTGHGRAKLKTGGGSLRNPSAANPASSDQVPSQSRRPLKATPSVLAGVADRSARFEQC